MAIDSRLISRLAGSLAFRVACYFAMMWMALWAEARSAPRLPDAVLEWVPYVAWVDRYNYILWLVAYVPVALWLLAKDAERFIRYMVFANLVLFMACLPIKMILRWTVNLKYIVAIPEWFFNI